MSAQTSVFDSYMAAKKEAEKKQVDISVKFEELCRNLLAHNDVNTFEKIISKIVHDNFMINVSGVTCKLDDKSINLCNKMFIMFAGQNIKYPINDYSKNDDILKFMENFKESNCQSRSKPTLKRGNCCQSGGIPFTVSLADFF